MLAVAGELADGVILGAGATPEVLDWARGCVAEGEARAGRVPGSMPLWVDMIVSVGEDRDAVRRALRPRLCNRANHNFRMGFYSVPDAHLAGVRGFRENYDETDVGSKTKNAERITDYIIDRFAFVGTPADVVARFETSEGARRRERDRRHAVPPRGALRDHRNAGARRHAAREHR